MLEVAQKYLQLKSGEYYKCFGKVDKVVGLTIESIGPKAKLNDLCMIFLDKERRDYVMSEVVGFKDSHIILMPFDNVEGVGVGCIVENTGHPLTVAHYDMRFLKPLDENILHEVGTHFSRIITICLLYTSPSPRDA